jgi:hypothetical protein
VRPSTPARSRRSRRSRSQLPWSCRPSCSARSTTGFRPQRSGGNGSQIKDRSAGTVIRYNRIETSNGWFFDLVEPENSWDVLGSRSTYKQAFVYGNVIVNDGGSQCEPALSRGERPGVRRREREGPASRDKLVGARRRRTARAGGDEQPAGPRSHADPAVRGGSQDRGSLQERSGIRPRGVPAVSRPDAAGGPA